jgi:2-dehydro-3-deoxyphosphogluconate aldolase / (4S)-4-hydroxy-2-oxoglutarate aldolase
MAGATSAFDRIRAERVVAVLRRVPDVDSVVDLLLRGGIRIVEVTLDSEDALGAIERLRGIAELTVLAGTVRTPEQAEQAAASGAEACVAPGLIPEMVERCHELGLPAIPGALTPTEIEAARGLGAEVVKLFPGSLGGPGYVRDLLAPLAGVEVIVTGGVDASSAPEFIAAGAVAVGVGSSLTGAPDIEAEARRVVTAVSP